ncbi:MAG: amidohydrolase family protein [Oscillospiraceae bacterium]|nr:amidohydrolase family protein [Oscillospiraceae bacterium]
MKIIDSHVHIYPEKIAEKASQGIADFYEMPVKYDGTLRKLLEICERNNVSKCVICSVATSSEQVKIINDFIASTCNTAANVGLDNNTNGVEFIGLCALHPNMSQNEVSDELSRVKDLGLKGIKLHPDIQKFNINAPEAYKIYRAAEGVMPILFHTGDIRYDFSNPAGLAEVLRLFPGLTAIGAHFGGWSVWEDADCLAGLDNLYVDTSSSLYELSPDRANALINLFGAERVLFGTDYPMWDVAGELAFIEKLGLSEEVKELIFYKNAERLYGL